MLALRVSPCGPRGRSSPRTSPPNHLGRPEEPPRRSNAGAPGPTDSEQQPFWPVLLRLQPSNPDRRNRLADGSAQRGYDIQVALQFTRKGFKGVILLGSASDFKAYRDVFQVVTKSFRPNKSLRVIYFSSLAMFIHTGFH
jgi:hypothetical protein